MGRPVVLSNGQLFVGLDESGLVHDFYYPYIGLDNLTNARTSHHKIGLWVDGVFRWVDGDSWKTEVNSEENALISNITMLSSELQLRIETQDFVDVEHNAFIRRLKVVNQADHEQDIRLFMHQVFQIYQGGYADTALYEPEENYILDYKGRVILLIAGKFIDGGEFDQFAVGNYGIEGKVGTFVDAEDGELSGNLVEHGGVDSVLRFQRKLAAGQNFQVDYWVVASDSQVDAQLVHTELKYHPIDKHIDVARKHWQTWFGNRLEINLLPKKKTALKKSLLIIKAHCDERGSVLASGDSSIFEFGRDCYCYCWPRDAAYAIWPLIRLGNYDEAKKFFQFARDTMHRDGYLMHKYQPDRTIGSSWHPLMHGRCKELAIQEDETAIVIFMLGEYYKTTQDRTFIQAFFDSFIVPCATFMSNYIDESTGLPHASHDLWEEKFLTSTYTVYTVIAALEAAAELAETVEFPDSAFRWARAAQRMKDNLDVLYHPDGYYRKGFLLQENGDLAFDDTLDISNFYGPYMFGRLATDDPKLVSTVNYIEKQLLDSTPIGGVIRYEGDNYFLEKQQYKGNPWAVCSLWLAQYYFSDNQLEKAQTLVDWVLDRQHKSGALSEQFDPDTGMPLGVMPLVWSHAELIGTLLDSWSPRS